jgi:hypothetical protein
MSIFPWRKHDEHHHCADAEKDHTRTTMIYLFGGSMVAMLAYGIGSGQIKFSGTVDAAGVWETMKFLAVGVFGWLIGSHNATKNNNNGNKPQGGESVQ